MLKFRLKDYKGELFELKWYPSEYLVRSGENQYCLAADVQHGTNTVMFGSTIMRQHNFIFDIDGSMVGIVNAECSEDENQVKSELYLKMLGAQTLGFASEDPYSLECPFLPHGQKPLKVEPIESYDDIVPPLTKTHNTRHDVSEQEPVNEVEPEHH